MPRSPPYRLHQRTDQTKQMIGLLRHTARHITQMRRQHIRNAGQKFRRKRQGTGGDRKVRVHDIRAPLPGFS